MAICISIGRKYKGKTFLVIGEIWSYVVVLPESTEFSKLSDIPLGGKLRNYKYEKE